MKRILLIVVLIVSFFTDTNALAQTFSAVSPSGHTLNYSILDANSVIVTGVTGNSSGFITIPACVINGDVTYLVTQIGLSAFESCNMTSISIPGTVSLINKKVFWYCNQLRNVYIMTTSQPIIGYNAFYNTPSNMTVNYPCGSNGVAYYYSILANHNISIAPNDSIMGSVAPLSIDLGATDSTAVIQATSNYGYHFVQWNDGNNNPVRAIPLVCNVSYIAIFEKNVYPVYGSSNETERGSVTNVSSAVYLDTVSFMATSNYGYHFSRWQNNLTDNPIQIVVTDTVNMTAYFDYNLYNISLYVDSSIHGYCNGGGDYPYMSYRDITATGNYGYHFSHWDDGNTCNPRSIQVVRDSIFTAYFDKNMYSVIGLSSDTTRGTVLGSNTLSYLDTVTLIAVPYYGYHIDFWSDDGSEEIQHPVIANMNKIIYAFFLPNQYSVQINVNNDTEGNINESSASGYYDYLSDINLIANANYGCHFSHWSDGDTNNPRTITLTQDTIIMAVFEKNKYYIVGIPDNTEKGNVVGGDTVEYLDTVVLTATPNYGYHFRRWSDYNTSNPRQFIATQNRTITAIFDYNQYTITLNVDSNILGSTNGGGSYNYLSEQTITATASYGYHFTSWNDGDTNNPRTITLTKDTIFTALFAKNIYSITAISADTIKGSVTGSTSIEYLDSVTITANPNYGYYFTTWNDGNTDNPRTIVATRDSVFTASFGYNQYTIALYVDTNIYGSVIGDGSYNYLSEQTITAIANYGYHFTGWSDGSSDNPRTITLTQDTVFTALFAKNIYSITAISADTIKGGVNGSTSIEYLDSVTIVAIPNYGYHFMAWNDGNTDNPRVIVATRDSLFTATFDHNQYTIALYVDTNIYGSVIGDGSYNYLSEQTITAMANYGYHFTGWSDGDTNNPRTITLTQDTVFTALFAKNIYSITVISADTIKGAVTGSTSIEYLDSVTIVAIPNYGYHFMAWNDGNTDNPRVIVATRDSLFTATFDHNQYTITLNVDTSIHGSVNGDGSYNYLSEQTITAIANYGYHFTGWSDGSSDNPRTITLTQDTVFTALFAKNIYSITAISADTIKGGVNGSTSIEYLDSVTIVAIPNYGYHFMAWNDGNTDNPRTIVATRDSVFTASFDYNQYTITLNVDTNIHGSVVGSGSYNYLSEQTITAIANYGYHFTGWSNGDTNNPRTIILTQDTSLTALFAKNQYTLTLQSEDVAHGGVIGGGVFEYLDTVAIEATAVEHYHFVNWNDGNTDNPRQYVITRDDTIIATFAIDTHHVSVESCNIAFGSVGGSGDFEYGTPATVTATGYSGYQFVRWSDGSTYNPYTFAVLQDSTLVAIFEAETQGIDDAFPDAVNVYAIGSQIVVETELNDEISIYDIVGRKVDRGYKTRFDVPASGVYLVKIGSLPTQKVVVVK